MRRDERQRAVRQHSRARGSVRTLLLVLAGYTDPQDGFAYPSIATLCRDLNLDRSNVQRAIRRAIVLGELRVERGTGRGHFSRYYVLCELPERAAISPRFGTSKGPRLRRERAATPHPKGRDTAQPSVVNKVKSRGGNAEEPEPSAAAQDQRRSLAAAIRDAPIPELRRRYVQTFTRHFGHLYPGEPS